MSVSTTAHGDTELCRLDRLVGTWEISGEATGRVTFAWLDGGHFLQQDVDIVQAGEHVTGIEIIGRDRPFGAETPSAEIRSRFYGNHGESLDYVYEMDGDTLTIWGGQKGSPARFRGRFSADGTTLTGRWVWPGGGYVATMSRIS
jgi:hypothetical protein